MGVFEMVVALVLIGTVGKVAQAFAGRSASPDADRQIQALEAKLRASEERIALNEERVTDLSEKLGFVEELLARPEAQSQLPPGSR